MPRRDSRYIGRRSAPHFQEKRPAKSDIISLLTVALGVVIGFPLLTALALQHVTSAHAIVYIGLLPLATAIFGVLRGGERRSFDFLGCRQHPRSRICSAARRESSPLGDTYMIASIIVCGLGYAEGARLSRRLGNWQVISWALVLSLPLMFILSFCFMPDSWSNIGAPALLSLAYVSIFSMLIGFVFWYRGLAQGGIAAVGQLQLLQPFFGLLLPMILHEKAGWELAAVNVGVIACVAPGGSQINQKSRTMNLFYFIIFRP